MNNGGPAFPTVNRIVSSNTSLPDYDAVGTSGLTVRDYFAAMAMQACINDSWRMKPEAELAPYSNLAQGIASDAYTIADAMIAKRSNSQ